jgi:hypothetical protein
MPTIDDGKRNAEQCLRWADEAANNEQRDTLLEIAAIVVANGVIQRRAE